MERIVISPNNNDLNNWIRQGFGLEASYIIFVIDNQEIRPFFVFKEQNIVGQLYKVNKIFGCGNAICVCKINRTTADDICAVEIAFNNLQVGIEN